MSHNVTRVALIVFCVLYDGKKCPSAAETRVIIRINIFNHEAVDVGPTNPFRDHEGSMQEALAIATTGNTKVFCENSPKRAEKSVKLYAILRKTTFHGGQNYDGSGGYLGSV